MRFPLVTLLLCLLPTSSAFGWNKPGHMVTGAIAYDLLKQEHPQTLARVLELLRQHPQYDEIIAKRLEAVPAENRDRYLFMIAARWADDIRNNKEYHRGPWHYINFPIVAPSDRGSMDPPAPADENILTALKLNLDLLRGDGDPAEKAVALCWVFHLIGDVHQPLHTTAFFSSQWPNGDKGGNAFHVRVRADRAVVNLHSLWDGLIIGSQSYQAVSNEAIRLRNRPDLVKAKLTELTANEGAEQWARESYDLAVEVAYAKGTLNGSSDRRDGPVLPAGYTDAAKAVAERRIVLAGYRLTDVLLEMHRN